MKKFVSLCLALVMCLALAVPAAAYTDTDPQGEDALRQMLEEARKWAIQEAGGTPGQVNVMINGTCVPFQGAWPEITNNRTMVPLRGVLEALGAKVDYEDATRTATVTLGETVLTHVIGTDTITASGGEALTMDVASYVKNNRTLVPVRFFSQALGYEVYWDKDFRTVVLVDKAALVEKMDSRFTILNGFQAKQAAAFDLTKNLQTDVSLTGNITIYDTINGNSKHTFSAAASVLQGQEGMEMTMKMDLTLLLDLLRAMDREIPAGMDSVLKSVTSDAIYHGNSTWYRSSLLDQMYRESGETVPAGGLWFKEDGGAYISPLLARGTGLTLGQALYATAEESVNPFFLYEELGETAGTAALFLSQKEIDELGEELEDLFLTEDIDFPMTIEMTLRANGAMDFSMTGVYEAEGVTAAKFSVTASGTPKKADMTVTLQLRNVCDLTLKGSGTAKTTDQAPRTQPPKDALIVDEDYGQMPLIA